MHYITLFSIFALGAFGSTIPEQAMDDETFYNLDLPEYTPSGDKIVDLRFSSGLDKRGTCGSLPGVANGQCVHYFSNLLISASSLHCIPTAAIVVCTLVTNTTVTVSVTVEVNVRATNRTAVGSMYLRKTSFHFHLDSLLRRIIEHLIRVLLNPGCADQDHIKGYKPTCAGNCYVDKFHSVKAVGDGTYSTNCVLYSDTSCQNQIGTVGGKTGGGHCTNADGWSMKCYYRC